MRKIQLKQKIPIIIFGLFLVAFLFGTSLHQKNNNVYQRMIKTDCEDDDVFYVTLGHSYYNRFKYVEAEAMFKKALEINPYNDEACVALGDYYNLQGKPLEAKVMFKKAHKIKPDNYSVYEGLGACYNLQGKTLEAEAMFRKAHKIKPDKD